MDGDGGGRFQGRARRRCRARRARRGLAAHTWQRADLRDWKTQETFDLVAAFFLHSPQELNCAAVLARFAARTRKDGILLSVGHYTLPPWAWNPDDTHGLLSASQLATALGIHDPEWRTILAEELPRTVADHDGHTSTVLDAVLHTVRVTGT